MSTDAYLELSENPIRFEPVNQLTNVFYDDSNRDVFTVRSGGVMGVVVKGPNENKTINFRMEDRGTVLSIKFSPDYKVLAVQRTNASIELMNFNNDNLDTQEYSVSCKKSSSSIGFIWSSVNELAIITDHGVELYTVLPEKKSLKHIKTTSVTVQWFVWCPNNRIVLLASSHGSQLQPVVIKNGSVNKLNKLETEPGRMALERDVTLATLYGTAAVLILRHQSGPHTAEVHVYLFNGPPLKSHVLRLGLSGRFAINVVDDLVLVHHQASRSSQLFDIALPGESDGTVRYHSAVAPTKSFKPTSISLPGLVEPQLHPCELYSPNWVVFQPNIVIDAKLGCLWHIKLCLLEMCGQIKDLSVATQVALHRTEGKSVLLKLLLTECGREIPDLDKLNEAFNHINLVYRDWVENELQSQSALSPGCSQYKNSVVSPRVLINQNVMFEEVFQKIGSEPDLRKTETLLLAYFNSLAEHGIPSQFNLNKLLVSSLARQNKFSAMYQLLQYGVIPDSKATAVLLLSLGNMHPSSTQMALDMLARLNATDEIQEVLLSENQLLAALKLAKNDACPRKYLGAAKSSGNVTLLHSVLYYFRNHPKYSSILQNDERLHTFINDYNEVYTEPSTT